MQRILVLLSCTLLACACACTRDRYRGPDTGSTSQPQSTTRDSAPGIMGPAASDASPAGSNVPATVSVDAARREPKDVTGATTMKRGATAGSFNRRDKGTKLDQTYSIGNPRRDQPNSGNTTADDVHGKPNPASTASESFNTTGSSSASTHANTERAEAAPHHQVTHKHIHRSVQQTQSILDVKEVRRSGELKGYLVLRVTRGSSPHHMGLRQGDLITSINGQPVRESELSVAQIKKGELENVQVQRTQSLTLSQGSMSGSSHP